MASQRMGRITQVESRLEELERKQEAREREQGRVTSFYRNRLEERLRKCQSEQKAMQQHATTVLASLHSLKEQWLQGLNRSAESEHLMRAKSRHLAAVQELAPVWEEHFANRRMQQLSDAAAAAASVNRDAHLEVEAQRLQRTVLKRMEAQSRPTSQHAQPLGANNRMQSHTLAQAAQPVAGPALQQLAADASRPEVVRQLAQQRSEAQSAPAVLSPTSALLQRAHHEGQINQLRHDLEERQEQDTSQYQTMWQERERSTARSVREQMQQEESTDEARRRARRDQLEQQRRRQHAERQRVLASLAPTPSPLPARLAASTPFSAPAPRTPAPASASRPNSTSLQRRQLAQTQPGGGEEDDTQPQLQRQHERDRSHLLELISTPVTAPLLSSSASAVAAAMPAPASASASAETVPPRQSVGGGRVSHSSTSRPNRQQQRAPLQFPYDGAEQGDEEPSARPATVQPQPKLQWENPSPARQDVPPSGVTGAANGDTPQAGVLDSNRSLVPVRALASATTAESVQAPSIARAAADGITVSGTDSNTNSGGHAPAQPQGAATQSVSVPSVAVAAVSASTTPRPPPPPARARVPAPAAVMAPSSAASVNVSTQQSGPSSHTDVTPAHAPTAAASQSRSGAARSRTSRPAVSAALRNYQDESEDMSEAPQYGAAAQRGGSSFATAGGTGADDEFDE